MPTYLDEPTAKPHINEVYMDDVYRVTHSTEEYERLVSRGWSPNKDPDKTYRPVHDTPEAHQRAWYQADAAITLQTDRLRAVADDENQDEKIRRDAKVKLNALKSRREVLDAAKAGIFAAAPAPAVGQPMLAEQKDKSPRKIG
jgi:hypothetical protein